MSHCFSFGFLAGAGRPVITSLRYVDHFPASPPWLCIVSKKPRLCPARGKEAMTTPDARSRVCYIVRGPRATIRTPRARSETKLRALKKEAHK